jgi:hypothetical protein
MTLSRRPATCFQGMCGCCDFAASERLLTASLELPKRGVLPHSFGEEGVASNTRVGGNIIERVTDVLQVNTIVLHSAR